MDPQPIQRVTMRDIAQKAGVSVMTVSRALKNHPRQSEQTRKRIQQLANDLGYRTHPYISALMADLNHRRAHPDAVNLAVFHFVEREKARFHEYFLGIAKRAAELGYSPELFAYDLKKKSQNRLRNILIARGIRGIILLPAREGFAELDFNFDGFAVASLGHTIVRPAIPHVVSDIYSTIFQALEILTARGYSRIGLVSTTYLNRLAQFLYSAGLHAFHRHVQPTNHFVELELEELNTTGSIQKVVEWIKQERLDAVVCPAFASQFCHALRGAGIQIPEELGYVHLVDYPKGETNSFAQGGDRLGAKAVDLVTAMIQRNEFQLMDLPQTVVLPTVWIEGKTAPFRRA